MPIPFDNLDADQREETLTKLSDGLAAIRREYRLSADAVTPEERAARAQRAEAGRFSMLQKLDALGLLAWYEENKGA